MYDLAREATPPASVRLVDNLQFQFGLALKPKSTGGLADLKSKAEKFFVTKIKGFEPDKMVACTLVFEGTRAEVEQQQKRPLSHRCAARGMKAGAENGRRGYQLTYSIAYIRDFLMNYYIIAESFETSVPWSNALALCENVKRRLDEEYKRRGLPGKPFRHRAHHAGLSHRRLHLFLLRLLLQRNSQSAGRLSRTREHRAR